MKYLIVLLLPIYANANWISLDDFALAKARQSGATVYRSEAKCLAKESSKCFNITNKDVRRWRVINEELISDPQGSTDADAEDQDKIDAVTRKDNRINQAETALTNWDSLAPSQKDAVLKSLLRDLLIRYRRRQE